MEIQKKWEQIMVKSVFKNKARRIKYKRGIFLTSVIEKISEKAILFGV